MKSWELHELLKKKEIKATEIIDSIYERIERVESKVDAYLTLTQESAKKRAEEVDAKISKGEKIKPLEGIPVAIKDNICTKGIKTTCASKILHNFVPPYDATVVEKLNSAGAVIIGKLNMDEFAMGSSTENSGFKTTKNPWDTSRIPGGSSGGSAASVSADETILALGSDTGGSIRQPASLCGVVGFKPTYGRVSRYGLVAFASSLDQIGPLTKDVKDCALLMNTIAGHDSRDSTSIDMAVPDYTENLDKNIKGMRIGIPKEYFSDAVNYDVRNAIKDAINVFEKLGCGVADVSLPHTEYAISVYYIVANAEASSNLARYDGVKYGHRAESFSDLIDMYCKTRGEGFGDEVKRRIMIGTYTLSSGYYDAYYMKALKVRTLIKNDFDEVFKKVDVVICPVSPTPAFKIGEKTADPIQMYLSDILTIPCNMAGLPGISIPCGLSKEGLPIGLQIMGKPLDEATVLNVANCFEKNTEHSKARPNI